MRKRVKCANCGMVYDITSNPPTNIAYQTYSDVCPKCGSNAYDVVKIINNDWQIKS